MIHDAFTVFLQKNNDIIHKKIRQIFKKEQKFSHSFFLQDVLIYTNLTIKTVMNH